MDQICSNYSKKFKLVKCLTISSLTVRIFRESGQNLFEFFEIKGKNRKKF